MHFHAPSRASHLSSTLATSALRRHADVNPSASGPCIGSTSGHELTHFITNVPDGDIRKQVPRPVIDSADSDADFVADPVIPDPLTSKLLGIGRKIGRLFELCNLKIPSHMVSSSAVTTTLSPDLWHSRLGTLPLLPSSSDFPYLALSPAASMPTLDLSPLAPLESTTDLCRSNQVRAHPSHLTNYHCYFSLATLHEPHTYREASINAIWQQAMTDELDTLHKTHTWNMTTLPPGKSTVDCKWVYKIKTRANGSVKCYKARLPLFQMNVKNAFLNGDLLKEVYMQPPPGYPNSQNQGFTPSLYDSALFICQTSTGITLILLCVDDMIITGDDTTGIHNLQKFLSQQFEMKDLGTISYFLGLEVTFSSNGYYLSQAKYASDLLSKVSLTDSKTIFTPLELNVKLNATDGEPLPDAALYRQLVGSLIYLAVTCLDLAYVVHLVSQFMSASRSIHYATVLRILQYIKGTLFHGLHFSAQSSLELRAYADADWAGDPTDCRSTTGYCFLLGFSLISWHNKKQSVVACSSTKAEYRALADATS
uniref:Reverse transcriptase Ty1/copia-type domain-containing protein n=1 Tax=Fagus sylvatica TaxID=28930 RepID=A0A2N9H5I8_FAGSY